jgi:hypothetical protein
MLALMLQSSKLWALTDSPGVVDEPLRSGMLRGALRVLDVVLFEQLAGDAAAEITSAAGLIEEAINELDAPPAKGTV